jgi:hypothetical protein
VEVALEVALSKRRVQVLIMEVVEQVVPMQRAM